MCDSDAQNLHRRRTSLTSLAMDIFRRVSWSGRTTRSKSLGTGSISNIDTGTCCCRNTEDQFSCSPSTRAYSHSHSFSILSSPRKRQTSRNTSLNLNDLSCSIFERSQQFYNTARRSKQVFVTSIDEQNEEENITFSERFTLHLPTDITQDKSELDYIRRTDNQEVAAYLVKKTAQAVRERNGEDSRSEDGAQSLLPVTFEPSAYRTRLDFNDDEEDFTNDMPRNLLRPSDFESASTSANSEDRARFNDFWYAPLEDDFNRWARSLTLEEMKDLKNHVSVLKMTVTTSMLITFSRSTCASWISIFCTEESKISKVGRGRKKWTSSERLALKLQMCREATLEADLEC